MTSVKISYYDYYGSFISEGVYVTGESVFNEICFEIENAYFYGNKLPCISETETAIPSFALLEVGGRKKIVFLED